MQHTLHQLTPHTHWLSLDRAVDRPTLGLVVGSRGTLLVDAGNSPAHARVLLDLLAHYRIAPPTFAVLTHWHWDHVFGSAAFDIPTFASAETARVVAKLATLDWSDAALDERVASGKEIVFCSDLIKVELPEPRAVALRVPDITFSGEITLDLGGITCDIIHVGGDHAHDSSVVYVREERVAFLGDCTYDDIYHGPRRLTTAALFPLLDRLLALEADWYIGGHDAEPISRAAFTEEALMLQAIGRTVEAYAPDREAIVARLPATLHADLNDDHIEIADVFLEGLRRPTVPSIC